MTENSKLNLPKGKEKKNKLQKTANRKRMVVKLSRINSKFCMSFIFRSDG